MRVLHESVVDDDHAEVEQIADWKVRVTVRSTAAKLSPIIDIIALPDIGALLFIRSVRTGPSKVKWPSFVPTCLLTVTALWWSWPYP
jgi:hypothetical protein